MDETLELLKRAQEWKRLAAMALNPAVRAVVSRCYEGMATELLEARAAHHEEVLGRVFGDRESG